MENNGYFPLYRKFQQHPFWKEKRSFSKAEAWIDLLWEARHQEDPVEVVIGMNVLVCNYGESLKSVRTWAKRWGWGEAKTHRFLKLLKKMGQIETVSETVTTRITILNYSKYDPKKNKGETQAKHKRNTVETQATTDNKDKEIKQTNFDIFWDSYPKKKSKGQALKAWKKIKPNNTLLQTILSKIEILKKTPDWKKENGQFIPHPATWLNGMGWEDETYTPPEPRRIEYDLSKPNQSGNI